MQTLSFPLSGEWDVHNPPGHHKNAFDFIAKKGGRPFPHTIAAWLIWRVPVKKWFGYGRPVCSPCDGVAEEARDGVPDRHYTNLLRDLMSVLRLRKSEFVRGDLAPFAGNHVIIRCKEAYVLIAHLREGTVRPQAGMKIKAGEMIGEVGNSGASLAPHLHLQVMDGPDFFTARVLPFTLSGADVFADGAWTSPAEFTPAKGLKIRKA